MARIVVFSVGLLIAILVLMGGCGTDSGGGTFGINGPLSTSEINDMNSLRRLSFEPDTVPPTDDISEDPIQDTNAIRHSGYASSLTATDLTTGNGSDETQVAYPLYTGGLPTVRDDPNAIEFYVANPFQSSSRIETLWYSRKGRLPLMRRSTTTMGFGCILQAQGLDPTVPNEGTSPFMNFLFHGTFIFIDAGAPAASYSFWPSSTSSVAPTPVTGFSTHVETSIGSDLPALRVVDTQGATMLVQGDPLTRTVGLPIHFAMNVPIASVTMMTLSASTTLGGPFLPLGTGPSFDVYANTAVPLPATAQGLSFTTPAAQIDTDYRPNEIFFVPVDGFGPPLISSAFSFFKLEIGLDGPDVDTIADAPINNSANSPPIVLVPPSGVTICIYFALQ